MNDQTVSEDNDPSQDLEGSEYQLHEKRVQTRAQLKRKNIEQNDSSAFNSKKPTVEKEVEKVVQT